MVGFIQGLIVGLFLLVCTIGYLYYNGSTIKWVKK